MCGCSARPGLEGFSEGCGLTMMIQEPPVKVVHVQTCTTVYHAANCHVRAHTVQDD